MMNVGVLGTTSLVAQSLQPQLEQSYRVIPFSRRIAKYSGDEQIPLWISLMPILTLAEWYPYIEQRGPQRIVALSSTSVFTKTSSPDDSERVMAERFADAEAELAEWSHKRSIECVILRPTLIYGRGLDRNISQIARFIQRFGFFPVCSPANGLRQPIHVDDVASACKSALETPGAAGRSFNISGGETIAYKQMVTRIFATLGKSPIFLTTPLWMFKVAAPFVRVVPKFHDWTPAMAERMNQDMIFDHSEAEQSLHLQFRPFDLKIEDVTRTEAG
jgi:nucleoside-diphosphate-sugar epimerase